MFEQMKGILAAGSMLRRLVLVNGMVLLLVTTLDAVDRLTGGSLSAVWPSDLSLIHI